MKVSCSWSWSWWISSLIFHRTFKGRSRCSPRKGWKGETRSSQSCCCQIGGRRETQRAKAKRSVETKLLANAKRGFETGQWVVVQWRIHLHGAYISRFIFIFFFFLFPFLFIFAPLPITYLYNVLSCSFGSSWCQRSPTGRIFCTRGKKTSTVILLSGFTLGKAGNESLCLQFWLFFFTPLICWWMRRIPLNQASCSLRDSKRSKLVQWWQWWLWPKRPCSVRSLDARCLHPRWSGNECKTAVVSTIIIIIIIYFIFIFFIPNFFNHPSCIVYFIGLH